MSSVVVTLFLRNGEGSGEARNCKVVISKVAPLSRFRLVGRETEVATEHFLGGDTHTITWQPGTLRPGAVAELQLRSDAFPFTESVSEPVRVTADRVDPIDRVLVVSVDRYDERNAEIRAAIE